jgi:class 3 adenylate cyclase/tetratricopeptide (TPR) repeat protein
MSDPQRSLATLLFTDIAGSTERAVQLGDRVWRELLEQHHDRVRRELRRFGGRELNVSGDGFLSLFPRPARAIICAAAIRSAVRELGLEVRCGVHMGEIEGTGKTVGGIGVHIAARVMAEAAPGEVLVSRSVRDGVQGAGFEFEDRGARTLKGVPGEWRLFAVTRVPSDAGETLPVQWLRVLSQPRSLMRGALVGVLLLGAGAFYASRREAAFELNAEEILAASAAPGIAVLPFLVNDPDLATWSEGLVHLLSMNLDGVFDLRAIDSRTVLARWAESVPDSTRPDLATALVVARRTGARYALVGSVVSVGGDLRMTADVYEAIGGTRLGHAEVSGVPDSIMRLVDRLTMEVLSTLPREEEVLADVDLAHITTDSLAALKAYLSGEALYRRGNFPHAATAFERAIRSDSTFALAWARLADTCGWGSGSELCDRIPVSPWPQDLLRRLPKRRAEYWGLGVEESDMALRQELARKYPDDSEAWSSLGDIYIHGGGAALVDRSEADRAFERAIALAPSVSAEPYLHLIENSISDGDSARAHRQLIAYERITRGDKHPGHLAFELGFGDPATRARALSALDTISTYDVYYTIQLMGHPRLLKASEEPLRVLLARPDLNGDFAFRVHYRRGKIRSALNSLNGSEVSPEVRALRSFRVYQVGPFISPEELEPILASVASDTIAPFHLLVGVLASDRGRRDEFDASIAFERRQARARRAAGDPVAARDHAAAAMALEGYDLWKRGRIPEAIRALEAAQQKIAGNEVARYQAAFSFNVMVRWWLGDLMRESGRLSDAERYYKSISADPFAALRLGGVYEALGEREKALESFEYALVSLADADQAVQPMVGEARRAIQRLERIPPSTGTGRGQR